MKVKGQIRIFANKSGFNSTVSRKNGDVWENIFFPISVVPDTLKDEITDEIERTETKRAKGYADVSFDGYLSYFETKCGEQVVKLVITDGNVIKAKK